MKNVPTLERDRHPTLETFERVLSKGVMVERGPADRRRGLWDSSSVAGVALLEFEGTDRMFGEAPFEREDSGDSDDE
jgi:hypothetical protein